MQPLQPMAPSDVAGRAYDYPVGYNLDTRPRGAEPISFDQLRMLAEGCDVLRSVIETRKDQMEALDWTVRVKGGGKNGKAVTDDQKRRIEAVTTFFMRPEPRFNWAQWQRTLLEDMFVIDAPAVYKRRDRKGRLFALEVIDGASIKLLIDESGRPPLPPDPAYQQILKGIPAVDYTADELLYLMHNPRSHKAYGYSHVEQILVTVNIAIRRALFQLDYYREGSQPDAFGNLPKEWNVDQIKAFQTHFDSMMAGNGANRRRMKFMPGEFKYQESKQPPLKDQYDEWLARVICHAFSISPEPFVQHTNRGTAETSHDRALQEGLAPLQRWVKSIIDPVIALEFESSDLEFAWADDREMDPKQAADINVGYAKAGIRSIDEIREGLGDEPLGGAFAIPMALTSAAYTALVSPEDQQKRAEQQQQSANPQQPDDGNTDDPQPDQNVTKTAYARLRKRAHKPVPFDRPVTRQARQELKAKIAPVLAATGEDVTRQVRSELSSLTKDALDDEIARQKGKRIADAIDLSGLTVLTDVVPAELEAVLADSGGLALAQVGVTDSGELVNQVNERAVAYARDRAAEMVGKRWVDGELVDSADAAWVITDATREQVRRVITRGLIENIGQDAIAEAIAQAGAFSEDRAELIANTEVAHANSQGLLAGYRAARSIGVFVEKAWLADEDPCPDCVENAAAGPIDLDATFPSGDEVTPAHPNCLPGYALVTACGDVTGATKRWYDGNLIVIHTASGHELTCTPNHPVLTNGGWVAAGTLDKGCNVISAGFEQRMSAVDGENQNVPARIEKVAESFGRSLDVTARPVKVAAPDFHGDGVGSEVAVVWANGNLRDRFDAAGRQHVGKPDFVNALVAPVPHDTQGLPRKEVVRLGNAPDCIVSSGNLSGAGILASTVPEGFLRGGAAANGNSSLEKPSADHVAAHAKLPGEDLFGNPADIEINDLLVGNVDSWFRDEVTARHEIPFSGFVYNIETTFGYYLAQGVIVHNCECTLIPVTRDEPGALA
ncbi:MAG: phage portal protein [Planctomycetes bacterium]|nr:phage portal protein [Planctomycetota bacterium]